MPSSRQAPFGGTCINRGCIPTKMFVYTADLAMQIRRAAQFGLAATLEGVDWPAIRDRIIARVDEISLAGRKERIGLDGRHRVRRSRPLRRSA